MPAVYRSFDIFALPSWNEGLPMSVLEAMAAGKPVVATEVGAVATAVVGGRTGILVRPGDIGWLTEAIASLAASPERARRMGQAGSARVRRYFTSEAMAKQYLELYSELPGARYTVNAAPVMSSEYGS